MAHKWYLKTYTCTSKHNSHLALLTCRSYFFIGTNNRKRVLCHSLTRRTEHYNETSHSFKKNNPFCPGQGGSASWEPRSEDWNVTGSIPSQGTCWGWGVGPWSGHKREATDQCFSLTSMLRSLSKSNEKQSLSEDKQIKIKLKTKALLCCVTLYNGILTGFSNTFSFSSQRNYSIKVIYCHQFPPNYNKTRKKVILCKVEDQWCFNSFQMQLL